jgi:hypothetical protein
MNGGAKMRRTILSGIFAVAFMASVSAQDKPSFAGRWKPDGSFTTYAIAVEGTKMTVTMTVAGNSESTVYLLDGTPAKKAIEGPNGPLETVRTSTWEGHVLVTRVEISNGSASVEKRWLEPDGTMRVQNILTMMQGKPAPPPPPGVAAGMVLKKVG